MREVASSGWGAGMGRVDRCIRRAACAHYAPDKVGPGRAVSSFVEEKGAHAGEEEEGRCGGR